MTERPIRFVHRGAVVAVADAPPTRTVLEWLREDAHCTGTKEGCAEGDCGACTVVIGERADDGGVTLRPVNACIQFLPTLDGRALFTVESLKAPDGALHPVQQAMVDCHGSQCGFCTPGFVMSIWAHRQQQADGAPPPTRQALADALSGNLCRCTGYRPILDAAQQAHAAPACGPDRAALRAQLDTLADDPPLDYTRAGQRYSAPRTLDTLAQALADRPQARLLAGSTDIGLWVTKQFRPLPDLIDLNRVPDLRIVTRGPEGLTIGAGVSLQAAWDALADTWPTLREMGLRFASPPVRSAGTMGGNVANGSPIGDSAPVLMALGARLRLRHGSAVREVPLDDFYLDYMKNRLQPGEFVQAIVVPPPRAATQVRAYKLSKRYDCDISGLSAGLAVTLDGDTVTDAVFAFGGLAATVRRATAAQAAVVGQPWHDGTVRAAIAALATDFTPLTDLRAGAAYRRTAAGHLLWRFWLQTRRDDPLPAAATNVWDFADAQEAE